MEGFIEIYKEGESGRELLFEDHNMIVDGAKEHIVNMLTLPTSPSAVSATTSHRFDASNFDIKAITLGPPAKSFDYRDSRFHPADAWGILDSESRNSIHHLQPYTQNWNFSGYSPNLLVPGSDMRILTDRDFKESLVSGGTDWTFTTLKGDPAISYDSGLVFKSSQPDEQVRVSQSVSLKVNTNYRFLVRGSGTDPIELRLSRRGSSTYSQGVIEYFDFDKKRFQFIKEYSTVVPVNRINLDSNSKEFAVEFRIPEYSKDVDFRGLTYDYTLDLLLPRFSDDVFSELKIEHVELVDLDLEIFSNNDFKLRDSLLINSDFRRQLGHSDEQGRLLGLGSFEGWTSHSYLSTESENILDDFNVTGSVRFIASADAQISDEPEEGYIALKASKPGWDTVDTPNLTAMVTQEIILPGSLISYGGEGSNDSKQLFLNFWSRSPSSPLPDEAQITLRNLTKGLYYQFPFGSEQPETDDRWNGSKEKQLVQATAGWTFSSIPVYIPSDFNDGDVIELNIAGDGKSNVFAEYFFKGVSFGPIPGWDYTYAQDSSVMRLVDPASGGGIFINEASNLTPPESNTFVSKTFTGIDVAKVYHILVKYSANATAITRAGELHLWGEQTQDYHDFNNNGGGHWHAFSGTPQAYFSGTAGSTVTSSMGPVWGFPEGDSSYNVKIGVEPGVVTIHDIKLVDSANMLDSSYPDLDLRDSRTSETDALLGSHLIKHVKNRWAMYNADATRDNASVQIRDKYVDFTYRESDASNRSLFYGVQHKDLNLSKGDAITFSFDHYEVDISTLAFKVSLLDDETVTEGTAHLDSQRTYDFSTKTWRSVAEYGSDSELEETVTQNTTSSTYPFRNYLSGEVIVPDPSGVSDSTWWIFQINPTANADGANFKLADFRYYKAVAAEDVSGFLPERANPTDRTLQTSGAGTARQGHNLNFIEFSGTQDSSSLSDEQILQHGCYLPGSGIFMASSSFGAADSYTIPNNFSGTLSGTLNRVSVINSDGFILENPRARSTQRLLDSSAGFIVSSTPIETVSAMPEAGWVSGNGREVQYRLSLMADDFKFLDYYYGGIGSIGLWTLDYEKTAKKLGDEFGNPPFWVSSSGTPYTTSLYNLSDTTQNPVFKLFAKKIFFPGSIKIPENTNYNDYITIVWGIKF